MRTGDMIGAYRIDTIGATAFAATHTVTGASVRLRWLSPIGDPAIFVQAARRLCGVQAPALHGLIDVGLDARRCYLVDEPLTGEALDAHLARLGPMRGDAGLEFVESLFSALVELHGRDVRDGALTPERIRVVSGRAVITEPGLGRLLAELAPDPRFAAPGATDRPTIADDLFAAAAIGCFAMNGRSLAADEAADATGASAPVVELLRACLAEDPADRPDDADIPRRTLEAVRAGTLSGAPPASTQAPIDGWFTDGSVEATVGGGFDYSHAPDELPSAQSAVVGAEAPAPPPPAAPVAPASTALTATPGAAAARPTSLQRPRPANAPRTPAPAPATRSLAPILVLLLVAGGGAGAWFFYKKQGAAPDDAPDATAAPAPITAAPRSGPPSAASTPSAATGSATSAAPASLAPDTYVTVQVAPGPARFVQVESKTVLCEEASTCDVPIDVDTRIEKDGFEPLVLTGDDLYDRRGHRWRVRIYEKGAKNKQ